MLLGSTKLCRREPLAASQRKKLRQRASVRKWQCSTRSSGHTLGSSQARANTLFTSGTWHSLQRRGR